MEWQHSRYSGSSWDSSCKTWNPKHILMVFPDWWRSCPWTSFCFRWLLSVSLWNRTLSSCRGQLRRLWCDWFAAWQVSEMCDIDFGFLPPCILWCGIYGTCYRRSDILPCRPCSQVAEAAYGCRQAGCWIERYQYWLSMSQPMWSSQHHVHPTLPPAWAQTSSFRTLSSPSRSCESHVSHFLWGCTIQPMSHYPKFGPFALPLGLFSYFSFSYPDCCSSSNFQSSTPRYCCKSLFGYLAANFHRWHQGSCPRSALSLSDFEFPVDVDQDEWCFVTFKF